MGRSPIQVAHGQMSSGKSGTSVGVAVGVGAMTTTGGAPHSWRSGAYATTSAAPISTGSAGQSGSFGSGDRVAGEAVSTQQPPWAEHSWNETNRPWWSVQPKGDYADPPQWGGWQRFRLWKKAVSRWHQGTDVSMWRRAEKLLKGFKGFDWELQAKFDHIPESVLSSSDYLTAIFQVMDAIAGEKETSERRRCIRAALYEGGRRGDESLSQYSLRRESQFSGAERFLPLPDELKAFMLEEQSGLSKQGIQNLRVLTGGRHSYEEVRRALRILDTEEESLFKATKVNYFLEDEQALEDEDSDDDEDVEAIFLEIEKGDMTEEAAMAFLAEHDNKKRKSWNDNRLLKAARKKDRRHFDDPSSRAGKPRNRREMTTAELKKITRCANCLQKGHWHEECRNPYKPRDSNQKSFGKERNSPGANAFAFFGQSSSEGAAWNYLTMLHGNVSLGEEQSSWAFLAIPPGFAIVDPGASQDLMGESAFLKLKERLRQQGLCPVVLSERPPPAAGVGGKAEPLYVALVPCALGGYPGVLKVTILSEDIPQLLSIGLLEHGKAVIDTHLNTIEFKSFGCQADMTRMESGHRLLDIADWSVTDFVLPEQVSREYGLKESDFQISCGDDSSKSLYEGALTAHDVNRSQYLSHLFSHVSEASHLSHVFDVFGNSAYVTSNPLQIPLEEISQQHAHEHRAVWLKTGDLAVNIERKGKGDMQVISESQLSCQVAIVFFSSDMSDRMREITEVACCHLEVHDISDISSKAHVQSSGKKVVRFQDQKDEVEVFHVDSEAAVNTPGSPQLSDQNLKKPISLSEVVESSSSYVDEFSDGQTSIGERLIGGSRALVSSGVQAAGFEEGTSLADDAPSCGADQFEAPRQWEESSDWQIGSSFGARREQEGVRPSGSTSSSWGQSIWQVGQVQSVRRKAELPTLLREQPTDQDENQEQDRGTTCASTEDDSTTRRDREDQEFDVISPVRCHEQGFAEGSSTADGISRGGDIQSSHAAESDQSDAAAHYAADVAESVQQQQQCSRTANSGPIAPCDQLGCGDGDGESQSARLGAGGLVRSLRSVLKHHDVSHQDHIDRDWLVAPLSSLSRVQLTKLDRDSAAIWQPDEDHSFVVWKNHDLVGSLVSSDDHDDFEFQIRREDKRNLLSILQQSFVTGNSKNSGVPHFASELRVNGPKSSQYCGEDARTSRNDNEKKKYQEDNEYCGGDARTPRSDDDEKSQEAQTQQEAKAQSVNKAVVSESLVAGLPGYVSPLRLPRGESDSHGRYRICEVFSPPRITPIAERQGFSVTVPSAFDLETGWNFRNSKDRAQLWQVLRTQEPDLVVLSPVCRAFSVIMNSNWDKMEPQAAKSLQAEGLSMLHFCVQIAEFQISRNKHFLLEHPGGASSWQTHAMHWLLQQANVVRFLFDQCAVGLSVVPDTLSRKVTGIVANNLGIASVLSKCQCTCSRPHEQLQQGLPRKAQVYPPGMIHKIIQGIKLELKEFSSWTFAQFGDDDEVVVLEGDEQEDFEEKEAPNHPIVETPVSSQEKEKIRLLHNNMGHLPKTQMLSLLKAAGGKSRVLRYVQDEFHCHQCMRQQRPISRRKAAFPRVFSFNRIIGIDFLYISRENRTLAFLNVVCHGTNLQQIGWLKDYDGGSPSSKAAWELFSQLWIRPFGLPEVLISDGGGEFRYDFERSAEQAGILHVVSDASSPWQNGRAERQDQDRTRNFSQVNASFSRPRNSSS